MRTPIIRPLPPLGFRGGAFRPLAALAAFLLAVPLPAKAEDPAYRLSADAAAGLALAFRGPDPATDSSAALWLLEANFLHRLETPGWGFVLSHSLDLAGRESTAAAFSPSLTVHEAYARLDLGDWGQLSLGKRRQPLGLGTTFAPGDLLNPRTGFWDQKSGFRGLGLAASLGSELALRGGLSLDRNFEAYQKGLKAKAAAGGPQAVDAESAYQEALGSAAGSAAGPADPRLLLGALSADLQLGSLELAASGIYSPGYAARPSLGLSLDLQGIILQAEGVVELEGAPDWHGSAGIRANLGGGLSSLNLSLDYAYNGAPGLLKHRHYLLSSASWSRDEALLIYARALAELEGGSALLSTGLTLYPTPGLDLEFTGLLALGPADGEFSSLAAPPTPAATGATAALGLAARVHF